MGGGGINTHEGRMLPHIYDEPLTGTNSPAFKFVWACHGRKRDSLIAFESVVI